MVSPITRGLVVKLFSVLRRYLRIDFSKIKSKRELIKEIGKNKHTTQFKGLVRKTNFFEESRNVFSERVHGKSGDYWKMPNSKWNEEQLDFLRARSDWTNKDLVKNFNESFEGNERTASSILSKRRRL